ncbi:MAG: 3'(2'),5'-bisphosphate nucleotidase CysQ [Ignavibacteria bacterium]|nr:3'(2'),5'-bisphosphate nucleotidase CysQ [Ignavibacteria bacterium]
MGVVDLAVRAGAAVQEIYDRSEGVVVERKADNSPLTIADRASHKVIAEGLAQMHPGIPVLSEEGKAIPYDVRKGWKKYWLVDPLDGTKEFISRNGEFTVNIALMDNAEPVAGVVFAPALNRLYYAVKGDGAYLREGSGEAAPIRAETNPSGGVVAAQSRSHASDEEIAFLKPFGVERTIQIGSSLKFCMIAEGRAHLYPRFGPMMEWDTAAGHAVVIEAGATVRAWKGGPLSYNTESLRHSGLVVSSLGENGR